ncbi:MAG: hypothetical protein ACREQY_22025 [Candidatus Binatia bacterium]
MRHAHFEPWFAEARPSPRLGARIDLDRALSGLRETLDSLARFVGAGDVAVGRVTPRRLRPSVRPR